MPALLEVHLLNKPYFQLYICKKNEYKAEANVASYRATVQRFRSEFCCIKEAIKSAKTLEELKAVKADFPTEIISAK
jgi:hypothetical protein